MTPEAFNAVHMKVTANIFFSMVIHDAVTVGAVLGQRTVGNAFVGADRAAALDIGKNDRGERRLVRVGNGASPQSAVALQHAEYDRLAPRRMTAADPALALLLAAHKGFVDFDVTRERPSIVGIRHVLANLVRHAPCRFVGAADLSFQFLRRNAVARRGHKVHGEEPVRERRAGLFKRCADARIDVVAAILAGIGTALGDAMKRRVSATRRANQRLTAVLNFHDRIQARRVSRVLGLELFEGVLAHRAYPLAT